MIVFWFFLPLSLSLSGRFSRGDHRSCRLAFFSHYVVVAEGRRPNIELDTMDTAAARTATGLFTEYGWVLLGFTGFYRVILDFIGLY